MPHNKMRIFVTGATGFVGSNLLKRLCTNYAVNVLVRKDSDLSRIKGCRYSTFFGDVTDKRAVEAAAKGCKFVIHLAACIRSGDEKLNISVNIGGTRNVLEACKKHGIKDIVHMSTVNVLADEKGVYGRTKREAEELVMSSGLRARVIRPTLIYGKGGKEFERLVSLTDSAIIPLILNGSNKIQPVYIDDVTEAIIKAMTAKPGIYGIAGTEPITFRHFLEMISDARGKRSIFLPIPLALLRTANIFTKTLTEEQIFGLSKDRVLDPLPTTRDLGISLTKYREGIQKSLE